MSLHRWVSLRAVALASFVGGCSSGSGPAMSADASSQKDSAASSSGGVHDAREDTHTSVDAGGHAEASAHPDAGADAGAKDSGRDVLMTTMDGGDAAERHEDSGVDAEKKDSSSEDAGASCATLDAAGKAYTGLVELSQIPASSAFSGIGAFYTRPDGGSPACNGTTVGACCYQTPSSTVPVAVSAGTITITDGTKTLATLPGPAYAVNSVMESTLTWAPGDTLKVVSTGGTFDAFTLKATAPANLAGVTPSFSASLTVPLDADYVVSWTPGGQSCSHVLVGLAQAAGLGEIGCVADDTAGTLTISKTLLGKFTATTGTAYIERVETMDKLETNAAVSLVIAEVVDKTTKYTH